MRRFALAAVALAAIAVAGCSSSSSSSTASGSSSSSAPAASSSAAQTGTITVLAAASLKETFTQLGKQFETAHPGRHGEVQLRGEFGPGRADQPAARRPTCSPRPRPRTWIRSLPRATRPTRRTSPRTSWKSRCRRVTPRRSRRSMTWRSRRSRWPCASRRCRAGWWPRQVFKNAKITVKPVTLQPDVKSVLTQVELGNVDAGVVYVTDVQAAGSKVKGVTIPANVNATTTYPIAALTQQQGTVHRPGLRRLRAVAAGRAGAHGRGVRAALS